MSEPLVSDLKLSGFKPSTGMMSFATRSHDPDFPRFFKGIGMISLAAFSSSPQQVFGQASFGGGAILETKGISTEGGGAGILVTSCLLGGVAGVGGGDGGAGRGVGGGVTTFLGVGGGVGTGVVMMGLGVVTGGFGVTGVSTTGAGGGGGTSGTRFGTCGTSGVFGAGIFGAGIFGAETGSPGLIKILGGGKVIGMVTPGGIVMSVPLQPSGKKYLMFSLRC